VGIIAIEALAAAMGVADECPSSSSALRSYQYAWLEDEAFT
jgi:hypothetical protein